MQPAIPNPAAKQRANSNIRTTALRFRAGQMIFEEGQKATRWYEVVRGTVRTCRFHLDGHRHLTGFFFSGDVFGADYGHYGTSAEAVTDVTVRCYRLGDISQNSNPKPQLDKPQLNEAVSILFRAMSSAQRYLFIMGHRTASERLAAFLIFLHLQAGESPILELPMSRSDIADFLGLTIHTVSRTFSDLARRGYIEVDGRNSVVITDHAGLCLLGGEFQGGFPHGYPSEIHPAAGFCLGDRSAA